MIRVGVCGFPRKRAELFRCLDVVEVQKTFYTFVPLESLVRLREEAPPSFAFTMKAFQGITHPASSPTYRRTRLPSDFRLENLGFFQDTEEVALCARSTFEEAMALQAKAIVFQCPPSFTPTLEHRQNLVRFFERFPRKGVLLAWEPRGEWREEDIRALCQELDLVHVVDPFKDSPQWGEIVYFRLHGKGSYRYRYSDEDLRFLAKLLKASPKDAFCLFNNVPMFENALSLRAMLSLFPGDPSGES
ncbi:DUF72 domain-containing protein [Candidatus Caldatribacterium sp. SIUC1]|uniref:DUF72 domain-containing protein n=1 Tax=Candidatus Caldatribacterium sp. SIUC1 TaxID=3418365 RepID=UPI003F69016D